MLVLVSTVSVLKFAPMGRYPTHGDQRDQPSSCRAPALPLAQGNPRLNTSKIFTQLLTSEVISTLRLSCCRKRERSGRCKASPARACSARHPAPSLEAATAHRMTAPPVCGCRHYWDQSSSLRYPSVNNLLSYVWFSA